MLCLAAIAAAPRCLAAAATALPGSSVYQLKPPLTDQDGQAFELASLRGRLVLASMFYSSCQMVCPMIFETIKQTVAALPPADRDRVRVLMVSFDPARDTTVVLKRTAEAHGCGSQWTLVRTDEANSRKVAALLGVQYRRLTDGEFNHSSSIQLLDPEGRIAARTNTLGAVDPAFLKKVHQALVAAG
ncbi:MAG: SCO family protein [Caldimonas sp.]